MDYLFLHRDKRTFTSERQKNLLFRAARLYWEQKYADSEVVPKRKVDCELYKYVLYYLEVRQVFLDPKLSLKNRQQRPRDRERGCPAWSRTSAGKRAYRER